MNAFENGTPKQKSYQNMPHPGLHMIIQLQEIHKETPCKVINLMNAKMTHVKDSGSFTYVLVL